MSKDALGHGSNKRGAAALDAARQRTMVMGGGPAGVHPYEVSNQQAAAALAGGGAKSAAVDTHPSVAGGRSVVPSDVAARFARQRAEAGQFRSGQREINRLRKQ